MLSTVECYDAWSSTYDSDGNILQLLDDNAFEQIVQPLLNRNQNKLCCELGCGTGRNTIKVFSSDWLVVRKKDLIAIKVLFSRHNTSSNCYVNFSAPDDLTVQT